MCCVCVCVGCSPIDDTLLATFAGNWTPAAGLSVSGASIYGELHFSILNVVYCLRLRRYCFRARTLFAKFAPPPGAPFIMCKADSDAAQHIILMVRHAHGRRICQCVILERPIRR